MLIHSFPAGPWQTNCYVVAPEPNSECFIVDPGYSTVQHVREVVSDQNLKPIAVLVTHGHLDHMWSVFPLASGYDIPAFVHQADRHLLSNPAAGVSAETLQALAHLVSSEDVFAEPSDVREIGHSQQLHIAGLDINVKHAPGHTAGSVLFDINADEQYIFTGDVLFAGAIGRTDLPGGSAEAMNDTLRNIILPIADAAHILPGHGPSSVMGIERGTNPYLRRIAQGLTAT